MPVGVQTQSVCTSRLGFPWLRDAETFATTWFAQCLESFIRRLRPFWTQLECFFVEILANLGMGHDICSAFQKIPLELYNAGAKFPSRGHKPRSARGWSKLFQKASENVTSAPNWGQSRCRGRDIIGEWWGGVSSTRRVRPLPCEPTHRHRDENFAQSHKESKLPNIFVSSLVVSCNGSRVKLSTWILYPHRKFRTRCFKRSSACVQHDFLLQNDSVSSCSWACLILNAGSVECRPGQVIQR